MNWTDEVRQRFERAGRAEPPDDVVNELAEHAQDLAGELSARGVAPDALHAEVTATIERWVASPGVFSHGSTRASLPPPPASASMMTGVAGDLRFALRLLSRSPAPALLAASTIAVAVAAVTLMAGLAWSILFKPLPWPDAVRLVRIIETRQGAISRFGPYFTNASWLAWRERATTIDALGAWRASTATLAPDGVGRVAERVSLAEVTTGIATMTGASPRLGRLFTAADERVGAGRVGILSYDTWMDHFAGRSDVVGRTLRLDGEAYVIVGVLRDGCSFPDRRTSIWLPLAVAPVVTAGVNGHQLSFFHAMARLKPGVTPAQAAAEATARARTAPDPGMVIVAVFGNRGPAGVLAEPALEWMTRDARPGLLVMLAAVALLLACAVANVANVQLTRAAARRREMGIRAALGAGTGQLVRQLLIEHVVLGVAGGAAGLLLARLAFAAAPRLLPPGTPRVDQLSFDWPVAAFSFACAAGAGIVVGIVPALHVRRLDLVETLAEDGLAPSATSLRLGASRLRSGVMVAQVAAATVLLVGGTLLTRSFMTLTSADRGFDTQGVLTATLPLPAAGYPPERRTSLVETLTGRLRQVPGVRAVGVTSVLPLGGAESIRAFEMPPRQGSASPTMVQAAFRVVTPPYFSALGLRVIEGRTLRDTDTATSRHAIVVNRAFARAYLDAPAVGRTVPAGKDEPSDWEVVGVIDDVRGIAGASPLPEMLISYRQSPDSVPGDPALAVRTAGDTSELALVLRGLLRDMDPELALADVRTMDARVSDVAATPRLYSVVVGGFAALALLISGVGLFGVLSYGVAQRSRELAVRAALGAAPVRLVFMVVAQALLLVALGVAAGFTIAILLGSGLSALLYGVKPYDTPAFALVAAVLVAVGAFASVVPAARAASMSPMLLLRRG